MYATGLKCIKCGKIHSLNRRYKCSVCGGLLDVQYDYERLLNEVNFEKVFKRAERSLWKYRELLPVENYSKIVSLGEGMTPLIKAEKLSQELGLSKLYLKDETRNPTNTFKDRPYTVALSKALELGVNVVNLSSSGNAAVSASAYSARAHLKCYVFVSESASMERIARIQLFGGRVVRVRGYLHDAFNLAYKASMRYGWYNISSTFLNPYTVEGDKTIAYELCEQLEFRIPDWILVPIGAGPLLVGCFKGFKELLEMDLINEVPRMVGVQSDECAPIVKAFREGKTKVEAWRGQVKTIASSIADTLMGYEEDGTYTLKVIRESKGWAVACRDAEIIKAVKTLARCEGVSAEPSSAIVISALERLLSEGVIKSDEEVVCLITGGGLREGGFLRELMSETPLINPDIGELEKVILRLK